jgi:hypothetical protein
MSRTKNNLLPCFISRKETILQKTKSLKQNVGNKMFVPLRLVAYAYSAILSTSS